MPDKAILAAAEKLAERMANHAHCDDHPPSQANPQCPFCLDRAAYSTWLASGGRDYQPKHGGLSVSLDDLIARTTGEARRAE
uniref:hypothetical protein n=1 Tax=Streptosporangium sp. CA-235898 TaxID=3240073 RepID=UPI003F490DD1